MPCPVGRNPDSSSGVDFVVVDAGDSYLIGNENIMPKSNLSWSDGKSGWAGFAGLMAPQLQDKSRAMGFAGVQVDDCAKLPIGW
jgi:hypothetical protein